MGAPWVPCGPMGCKFILNVVWPVRNQSVTAVCLPPFCLKDFWFYDVRIHYLGYCSHYSFTHKLPYGEYSIPRTCCRFSKDFPRAYLEVGARKDPRSLSYPASPRLDYGLLAATIRIHNKLSSWPPRLDYARFLIKLMLECASGFWG